MSTTLAAGTATSGAALSSDTSGILQLQSGSTPTTGITLSTAQSTTLNSAASTAPLVTQINGTEVARIDSSGRLLIGTTTNSYGEFLNVTSASSQTYAAFIQNSSGSGYSAIRATIASGGNNTSTYHFQGNTAGVNNWYLYGNGTTSYSSDQSLKKNIQTTRDGYLADLNKLRVVKYQWKGDDPNCQQVELGLIAQEVEQVFPKLIQEHEFEGVGTVKNIKQSVLPFMLLKALQELSAQVTALQTEVTALKAKVGA